MKTDLFQSCGHCWVFQICWHIECNTLTASSFRIWNSSAGIPSPPLTLFIVMHPKVHLTTHSRMSASRWVITPSWLSGSWRSFLYSSSVYSCHLFLISSASARSIMFMSFIVPIFTWNVKFIYTLYNPKIWQQATDRIRKHGHFRLIEILIGIHWASHSLSFFFFFLLSMPSPSRYSSEIESNIYCQ